MEINRREMGVILDMFDISEHEGQETDEQIEFVERIRKAKREIDVMIELCVRIKKVKK